MEFLELLKQLFTISFSVLVALVLAFYVIWPKIQSFLFKLNAINKQRDLTKQEQQLKFTAYERLLLFAQRIAPYQVMLRNHNPNISLNEFKRTLINDIENEYQHNFTQQLYVSDAAWVVVRDLKESTVSLLNNAGKTLQADTKVEDYIAVVLKHVSELEVNPYDAAQIILKKELSA